ncbi:HAD family hydrolase [Streptomyces lavendulae]|uniref:HAD family hydrolase n=1 Tax=Streptomyces lavendulae TaxID=1914 RepID=UPI00382B9327
MHAHIVWDWNGTLLDDVHVALSSTNAAIAKVGLPPMTLERYRELYRVPVWDFYEELLGRAPTDEEWATIGKEFGRLYRPGVKACELAAGSAHLLTTRRNSGITQSLCSLMPQVELLPMLRARGIEDCFQRVDGRTGSLDVKAGKAEQMARHLSALEDIDPGLVVVIGDAVDDAVAAAHAGARSVLYTGGAHSRSSLEKTGAPVVGSLTEAVALADALVRRP